MTAPRIALAGMVLESNAFARPALERDFRAHYYLEGGAILEQARSATGSIPKEMCAFVSCMDATGPWSALPLVLTGCQPSGPVDQPFFARTLDAIVGGLEAAGRIDGVYVANHGAMVASVSPDPDGVMLSAIRKTVGSDCPIVCTLDLHANVSSRMARSADVLVAYLTNPHVDMLERGEEAAHIMRAVLAGLQPVSYHIRLPLVPPSVSLLSACGPYGELIDYGQRRKRELGGAILNVSITGGFAFSDTPCTGLAVTVTARRDARAARALAEDIAHRAWRERERFKRELTSLAAAISVARDASGGVRAPVIFSDAGDNPGGGGSGRTTELLSALVRAGIRGVLFGSFHDPALAAEAHAAGEGAELEAVFNRSASGGSEARFSCAARVLALSDGAVVGRRGLFAGRALSLGASAALSLGDGGVVAVVISERQQTADPVFFEMLGLDPGRARVVCVKSRGHFRAGFDRWFPPDRVFEVDTPGLTSPVLERFAWRGLPRPVYPLDEHADWHPPEP